MEAYPSSRDPPSSPTSRWGRALPKETLHRRGIYANGARV